MNCSKETKFIAAICLLNRCIWRLHFSHNCCSDVIVYIM